MDPMAAAAPLGEAEEVAVDGAGVEDDEEGCGDNCHHGDQRWTEADRGSGGRLWRRLVAGNKASRNGGRVWWGCYRGWGWV